MKKVLFLTAVCCFALTCFGQSAEEEKIKKVVLTETEAFYARNYNAWKGTWAHDPKVSRTLISNNQHSFQLGWDEANRQIENYLKNNTTPASVTVENKNYNIVQQGGMAWVYYDQWLKSPNQTSGNSNYSREYRVLVKQGNDWKIISQVTTFPESFDLTQPTALQNNLNSTGYALLNSKKTEEAIEVFKMAVKLFPQSWNAYDSLAEAYERNGNKTLAVENYEQSIKMNPKNENATKALAKLKTQ